MKPRSLARTRTFLPLATALAALLSSHALDAGVLTWDGSDTTTTGAQGGTGNWDVNSTANWWNGTADVVWPALGGTADDAVFNGTAGTVTLNSAITAHNLTFNTTGYTLSGANTLTLNGTTPTVMTGTGITATIGSVVGGSAGLTKVGTGTLNLSGTNTYTGTTTLKKGALTLEGTDGSINDVLTIYSGGTLTLNNTTNYKTNRLGNGKAFTSYGGTFNYNVNTGSGSYSESIGALSLNAGALTINTTQATSGQASTLTFASMTSANRAAGGTVLFSGTGLGTSQNKITFTTAPTTTAGIIPWALIKEGSTYDLATLSGNDLAKYTGYTTAAQTTWADNTINARPSASQVMTATVRALNTLVLDSGINVTSSANSVLTVGNGSSPGVIIQTSGSSTIGGATRVQLDFGTREAVFNIQGTSLTLLPNNTTTVLNNVVNLTKTGPGALVMGADTATGKDFRAGVATGALYLNEGLYEVYVSGSNNSLSFTGGGINMNGGNLKVNIDVNGKNFANPIIVNADGTITLDFRAGAVTKAGVTNTFSTLTVNNSPNLTLTAGTNVTSGTEILTLSGATTLNSDATFTLNNSAAATMQLSVAAITDNGNSITLKGNGKLIQTVVWAGTGGLTLDSTYTGTATLSQANTYTGATTVNGGTLKLDGSGSIANSSTIIVGGAGSSGAVLDVTTKTVGFTVGGTQTLKGIGTISGATTLASGAIHAPGNSPGVQIFTNNLTYADGSIFSWEIDRGLEQARGTGYDGVNVGGTLAGLDGADTNATTEAIFRIVIGESDFSNAFWASNNYTWTDIFTDTDGTTPKSGWASIFGAGFEYYNGATSIDAPTTGTFTMTGNTLSWNYTAVPEPTSALAGLLLGAGLLRRRRK